MLKTGERHFSRLHAATNRCCCFTDQYRTPGPRQGNRCSEAIGSRSHNNRIIRLGCHLVAGFHDCLPMQRE